MNLITNPWKGLASYEEQDVDKFEFCGRTQAIGRYYSLITNNLISTLYGKTGCGKTSLLQVGLFPLLRREAYFPVMCRMSLKKENETFTNYLRTRVQEEANKNAIRIETSNIGIEQTEKDNQYELWNYFYGHEFRNEKGNIVFPIIVLDQFEEVLINNREESVLLLKQISYLIGDDLLLPEDCYANFRVTIALREDFLYLLEDTLDYAKLPQLRENRMRLSPLNHDEASEVVAIGREMFVENEYASIRDKIIDMALGQRGQISTNILSLFCSQIYEVYQSKENEQISLADIEKMGNDPLRDFYLDCANHLSSSTQKFIENKLILNEFRRPVTIKEFKENVSQEDREIITKGKFKILQMITAGDNECVELIHDTLARTIYNIFREHQKTQEEKETRFRRAWVLSEGWMYLCVGFCWCLPYQEIHVSIWYMIVGGILMLINWLFSVATCGEKTYPQKYVSLLIFTNFLYINIYSIHFFNQNESFGVWGLLSLILPCCALIASPLYTMKYIGNLPSRPNATLGYIFSGGVFRESKIARRRVLWPIIISSVIILGLILWKRLFAMP